MPEIQAARQLRIGQKRRMFGIIGMDRIIQVDEGKRAAPRIGIEKLQRTRHTRRTLVRTRRTQTPEIVVQLQVRSCEQTNGDQAEADRT